MSSIPLEIDERIIDLLAEDDKDYSAIKTCSLVCRTFLPLCRKHIFALIILNRYLSPTTRQLERLLSQSPEIADYIRNFDYTIVVEDTNNPLIHRCLKRISGLRSFSVRHHNKYIDWSSNDLRPVLLHLLHLPTLTHFKITAMDKFTESDLIPCINLKKLDIGYRTNGADTNTFSDALPDCSIRLNELVVGVRTSRAIINICKAQRPDGRPVIDFSSLAKITVQIDEDGDIKGSEELFKRCRRLTHVYISLGCPNWVRPSLSEMLRPSMQTLTHLDITAYINDIDLDPLVDIPSELEAMRNKNVIKNIVIKLHIQANNGCKRGDDWGRLDEVLTRSGWMALREVSVTIDFGLSRNDRLDAVLRMLPQTDFPRLSTSQSVLFKFRVIATGFESFD